MVRVVLTFHLNKRLFSSDTPTIKYVITVIEAQSATWTGFHSMLDGRSGRIGGLRQSGQTGFHNEPLAKWEDGVINTDNILIVLITPISLDTPLLQTQAL